MKRIRLKWLAYRIWIDASAEDTNELLYFVKVRKFDDITINGKILFKEANFIAHICK